MSDKLTFNQQFFPQGVVSTNMEFQQVSPSVDPLPWDINDAPLSNMVFEEGLADLISSSSAHNNTTTNNNNIINNNNSCNNINVEPTPIGSNNIDVVERIPFTEASWLQVGSLATFLKPLLSNEKKVVAAAAATTSLSTTVTLGSSYCTTSCDDDNDEETVSVTSSTVSATKKSCSDDSNFKASQLVQWNARYEELVQFRNRFGHCLVPLLYPENPGLAHWIKRQRYQYSLKQEGKHSTLSVERENSLEQLGFIWDSHAAQWEERLKELEDFRTVHGHCFVPTKYPINPKLSIWVKCQRRQFKLFQSGARSNITTERITQLLRLGFVFHPRMAKQRSSSIKSTQSNSSSSSDNSITCL